MMRWISALAPTSMPRVGWSRMRIRGDGISHFASSTFCWLPPESVLVDLFDAGRDDLPVLAKSRRALSLASNSPGPTCRKASAAPARSRWRGSGTAARAPADAGPPAERRCRGAWRRAASAGRQRAINTNLAAIRLDDPEQHLGDFRAAGADKTEEAENLAGADLEAHILDKRRA